MEFIHRFLSDDGFMPHGHRYLFATSSGPNQGATFTFKMNIASAGLCRSPDQDSRRCL